MENTVKKFLLLLILLLSSAYAQAQQTNAVTVVGTPAQYGFRAGASDVTTGFQNMMAAVTSAGATAYLPCGTYHISAAATVASGSNWNLIGEGRRCVTIEQDANATPVIKITGANVWGWRVSNIQFTWGSAQTSLASDVVEVTSTGIAYIFEMDHLSVSNGTRVLSEDSGGETWGVNFHDNYRDQSMSGRYISMAEGVGEPRFTVYDNYAQIAGATQIESLWEFHDITGLTFTNNEVNGKDTTAMDGNSIEMLHLEEVNGTVDGFNVEAIYWKNGGDLISAIGGNGNTSHHVSFANLTLNAHITDSNTVAGVVASSSGANPPEMVIDINGDVANAYSGSSAYLWPYSANYNTEISRVSGVVAQSNGIAWPTGVHFNPVEASSGAYAGALPETDYDIQPSNCTNQPGNNSLTLGLRSQGGVQTCGTIEYKDTLTANRSVTLPPANSGYDDGSEITILRDAGTPGAYTLTITDPSSGNACTIPNSTKGSVVAHAVSTTRWTFKSFVNCS